MEAIINNFLIMKNRKNGIVNNKEITNNIDKKTKNKEKDILIDDLEPNNISITNDLESNIQILKNKLKDDKLTNKDIYKIFNDINISLKYGNKLNVL